MASTLRFSFIFLSLLLSSLWIVEAHTRKLISIKEQEGQQDIKNHLLKNGEFDDPTLYMYFKMDDLKLGNKLRVYFDKNDLQMLPPLLTRQEADLFPFTMSKLDLLLDHYFSIPKDSPQGKAVKETLGHCDAKTVEGENKFCATSLESMLDLVKKTMGPNADLKVMTTSVVVPNRNSISYALHNYTISKLKELVGIKMLACHRMPYPYVVYYCHGHKVGSRVFEVSLVTDDGRQRVVGPAVCHMDTSMWNKDHVAFKVLKMEPAGSAPVCHFFPLENIVWVTK